MFLCVLYGGQYGASGVVATAGFEAADPTCPGGRQDLVRCKSSEVPRGSMALDVGGYVGGKVLLVANSPSGPASLPQLLHREIRFGVRPAAKRSNW